MGLVFLLVATNKMAMTGRDKLAGKLILGYCITKLEPVELPCPAVPHADLLLGGSLIIVQLSEHSKQKFPAIK